jgi:hypothetical protein
VLNIFEMELQSHSPLCANNGQQVNAIHIVCEKKTAQSCGSCNLVKIHVTHPLRKLSTFANNIVVLLGRIVRCRLAARRQNKYLGFHEEQVDSRLIST